MNINSMRSRMWAGVVLVSAAAGIAAATTLLGVRSVAADPPGQPALGSAVPPIGTEFVIAALVVLEGSAVGHPDAMLYVSRKTYNRLRDEAGGSATCDKPGLQFTVVSASAAEAWGIPVGSTVVMTQVRHGVPVPVSIVAGDEWFASGGAVQSPPCGEGK